MEQLGKKAYIILDEQLALLFCCHFLQQLLTMLEKSQRLAKLQKLLSEANIIYSHSLMRLLFLLEVKSQICCRQFHLFDSQKFRLMLEPLKQTFLSHIHLLGLK